jgi:hypothetical protein
MWVGRPMDDPPRYPVQVGILRPTCSWDFFLGFFRGFFQRPVEARTASRFPGGHPGKCLPSFI